MPFRFSLWFFFYLAFSILPVTITFSHRVPAGLLNGSSAAAIQGGGDIRIYYQAVDSSLHEWRSYAPNNESYVDTFLVSGNKARADSPLAAIVESPSNLGEVRESRGSFVVDFPGRGISQNVANLPFCFSCL